MANRKISDLTALTAPVTGDLLPIVDISEAAAADKNKKITYGTFLSSVPLGTAAAPSIAFTGDINTGIYSPGADQLAISTGGTGRVFVDASGNVAANAGTGGGLVSIQTGFSVIGGTTTASTDPGIITIGANSNAVSSGDILGRIRFYSNDASTSMAGSVGKIECIATGNFVGSAPTALTFFTNNGVANGDTERLRITSAGLGVGVSAPQDVIHAKGNSTYAGIIIDNSSATGGSAFIAYRNGVQKAIFSTDSWLTGTVNDNTAIYSADGIKFYTNNSAVAKGVLDSSGRLLVGTSSDSGGALFQVNGDRIRVGTAKTPASASDTGTAGEICWDASYIYVCTATNTWKRTAIATW